MPRIWLLILSYKERGETVTWVSIVFWIITHAPDLIEVIKMIFKLIGSLPKAKQDAIRDQVSAAIKTGKTENVKAVLQDQHSQLAQPMDLVK